ncbi:MAG: hypothetical protein JST40_06160 [Armatimonadetes bacterium]|nr:hypothetical protein [Armatimonadota bacterium]
MSGVSTRFAAVLVVFGLGSAINASPTALNVMPIADTLGHREGLFYYTLTGTERKVSKSYAHANAIQVGLTGKVEFGFDNDFEGGTVLNAKYNFFNGEQKQFNGWALSAGFTGLSGDNIDPYVVGRRDLGKLRLHAGYWRVAKVNTAMFGADYTIDETFSILADHLSGTHNMTYLGLYYNVPILKGLQLGFTYGVNGNKDDASVHFLTAIYGFRL